MLSNLKSDKSRSIAVIINLDKLVPVIFNTPVFKRGEIRKKTEVKKGNWKFRGGIVNAKWEKLEIKSVSTPYHERGKTSFLGEGLFFDQNMDPLLIARAKSSLFCQDGVQLGSSSLADYFAQPRGPQLDLPLQPPDSAHQVPSPLPFGTPSSHSPVPFHPSAPSHCSSSAATPTGHFPSESLGGQPEDKRAGGPLFQVGTPRSNMSCGNSSFDRLESDSFCPPTEGVPAVLSRRIEELEQQLERDNENRRQLAVENEQLHGQLSELRAQDHVSEQSSRQLMAYEQELKTKRNTIELLVAEKSELESKVWKPVLEQ